MTSRWVSRGPLAVAALLVAVVFAVAPVRAQDRGGVWDAASTPTVIGEDRLWAHLEVRAAALRAADEQGAELALSLLEETRDRLGARDAVLPAAWLTHEGRRAMEAGDLEVALNRSERAIRLAPDYLPAHWTRLAALYEQDPLRVARLVEVGAAAVAAWAGAFRNQVNLVTIALASALLGGVLAAAVFGVALLLRHLRYQAHDAAGRLPRVVGGGEMSIAIGAGLLAPAALGFGWLASVVLALVVTLAYQSWSERALSLLGAGLLSAMPVLVGLGAPLVAFHGSRVDHIARVQEQSFTMASERLLLEEAEAGDGLTHVVLGVRAARRRDVERARRHLEAAIRRRPDDVVALNDLAVLEYRQGRHELAEKLIARARRASRRFPEPFLNASLMAGDRGDFEGAEEAMAEARRIDAEAAERVIAKAGLPTDRRLGWLDVPSSRLWAALWSLPEQELSATRHHLMSEVSGPGAPAWAVLPWALLGLGVGVLGFRRRRRSVPCARCGAPAKQDAPGMHCSQCQSVFMGSGEIAPATRRAKEREVLRHHARQRWGLRLAAVVPGLSETLSGHALVGALRLLVVGWAAGWLLSRELVRLHAWQLPGAPAGEAVVAGIAGVVVVGSSALSIRAALRRT